MGEGDPRGIVSSVKVKTKAAKTVGSGLYNLRRVKGAGVLFVLLWNLLIFSYQTSALGNLVELVLAKDSKKNSEPNDGDPWNRSVIAAILSDCVPKMFYPFAGWLADAKLGRYKVMRYSLWMMWVGSILLILTSIVRYTFGLLVVPGKQDTVNVATLPVYVVIYLINAMGTAGYHVNVIPFGIDQMEGASGDEIASFVHWYYWTRNFNFGMIVQFALQIFLGYCREQGYEHRQRLDLFALLIQMVFLTAAVCLDFTFSSKLHKDAKIHNTVKKVKDVSVFILRHDQPVGHRKAHTFTYEAPPVRSDFAKQSYGGPFEDDEVEEVTSFWRIIVILLAGGFGVFLIQTGYYNYPSFYEHMDASLGADCTNEYVVTNFVSILTFSLCIPLFEFLIYPFLRNKIPRTTVRIGVGMFVVLFGLSSMLTMDAVAHSYKENGTGVCMFYSQTDNIPGNSLYLIIVIVIMAVGELLVFLSTLEFICAQAPYSMRGLMIGINFMIYGLSVGILSMVLLIFSVGMRGKYNNHDDHVQHIWGPSCGTWYISTVLVIGCVGTALYIIAAKRYRKRQRGGQKDVNQQTILEGYYERSVKYKQPMNFYYQQN